MHLNRVIGVALALALMPALLASSALAAPSSTVYPAGDSVSASSVPITVTGPGFANYTCTLHGGSFTIPTANHNGSGPVVLKYLTRPTINECSGKGVVMTIFTQEAWTLNAQYGEASPSVTIPTGGLIISRGCEYRNYSPISLGGDGWFNGFTSPVSVSSALAYGGSVKLTCVGSGTEYSWTFGTGLQTLTDTTHPSSLPLLGP